VNSTCGIAAGVVDEYCRTREASGTGAHKRFAREIIEVIVDHYTNYPNGEDVDRLLALGQQRSFSCMLGSIDCML
jgi:hypothetical protein